MSITNFRKLYFPGLISLVFLPAMCIGYLISNNSFHKYQAMTVFTIDNEGLKDMMRRFKWPNLFKIRNYKDFIITGDTTHDYLAFKRIEIFSNQLATKNDTTNGLSVSFGDHSRYAELVYMLDICNQNIERNLNYQFVNGKILIYFLPPTPKSADVQTCLLCNDVILIKPKQPFVSYEKIHIELKFLCKTLIEFWPSVIAFLLMLTFVILKKCRFLNLKTFQLVGR